MIDLYYWTTPNGRKITIFLDETGTPCRIVPVNISKGVRRAYDIAREFNQQPAVSAASRAVLPGQSAEAWR